MKKNILCKFLILIPLCFQIIACSGGQRMTGTDSVSGLKIEVELTGGENSASSPDQVTYYDAASAKLTLPSGEIYVPKESQDRTALTFSHSESTKIVALFPDLTDFQTSTLIVDLFADVASVSFQNNGAIEGSVILYFYKNISDTSADFTVKEIPVHIN